MKNHGHKRLIAFFIVISIFFSLFSLSAAALTSTNKLTFEKTSFEYQVFSNQEAYMELGYGKSALSTSPAANTSNISVSDLSINGFGEEISLKISIDNQQQAFVGTLYPVVGGGYFDDKLVLGDFAANKAYNVVLFQLEKTPTTELSTSTQQNLLTLVLENLNTGEVLNITFNVADEQFSKFHDAAMRYYETLGIEQGTPQYSEMASKITSLMIPDRNWSNANSSSTRSTFTYDSVEPTNQGQSITEQKLRDFYTVMEYFGNTHITLANTLVHVISQTGWKVYHNPAYDYFYVLYGYSSGGVHYVQMTYCKYSSDVAEGNVLGTHLEVSGSVSFRYIPSDPSPNCVAMFLDDGPALNHFYLCQSELADSDAFFINSKITYSLLNHQDPWARFLLSSTPGPGGTIVDFWEALASTEVNSEWGCSFHRTAGAQLDSYGRLIKDIGTYTGNAGLKAKGNYLALDSGINGTYVLHKVKFKFSAVNSI